MVTLKELNCLNTAEMIPERNEFEAVYRFVKGFAKSRRNAVELSDLFSISTQIAEKFNVKINYFKLKRILEIFDELGLLNVEPAGRNSAVIGFMETNGKVNLDASRLYSELQRLRKA